MEAIYRLNDNEAAGIIDTAIDGLLISALQKGLPFTDRPYADIAAQTGIPESRVIERISALKQTGIIKRFGVIVRHHELGYRNNAMVVWDIPDEQVRTVAERMKQYACITLCYRRPRQLPEWPYNLFCMIHGRDRESVRQELDTMVVANGWRHFPHEVLFTKRRFKQRGVCSPVNVEKIRSAGLPEVNS